VLSFCNTVIKKTYVTTSFFPLEFFPFVSQVFVPTSIHFYVIRACAPMKPKILPVSLLIFRPLNSVPLSPYCPGPYYCSNNSSNATNNICNASGSSTATLPTRKVVLVPAYLACPGLEIKSPSVVKFIRAAIGGIENGGLEVCDLEIYHSKKG
jgi:hypothetical protein